MRDALRLLRACERGDAHLRAIQIKCRDLLYLFLIVSAIASVSSVSATITLDITHLPFMSQYLRQAHLLYLPTPVTLITIFQTCLLKYLRYIFNTTTIIMHVIRHLLLLS